MKLILLFVVFLLSNMLAFSQAIEVDSNGNVGIGTTTPNSKLDIKVARTSGADVISLFLSDGITGAQTPGFGVRIRGASNNGNAISDIGLESGGSGTNNESQISFYTQNVAGGLAKRMLINSVGNIGIGTTNPTQKLQIGDATTAVSNSVFHYGLASGTNQGASYNFFNGSKNVMSIGNVSNIIGGSYSDDAGIYWDGANSLRFYNGPYEKMRITSLGHVAIGTSSFGTHHNKALGIYGDTHCSLKLMTSASGTTNNDGFEIGVQDKHGYIQNREVDGKICFHTNNTERVQISATGNVGIGTIAPNYKFHLYSTGDHGNLVNEVASSSYISRFIASDGTPAGFLDYEHSTDDWVIRNNSIERMRITSLGHVAIGTSSFGTYHNKTLGIYGDTHCSLKLMTSSSGTTNNDGFEIGVQNNHGYIQNREADGKIYFLTNNTERVQISATGNVGIGTTTPTEKLEVNGSMKVTGNIMSSTGFSAYTNDGLFDTLAKPFIITNPNGSTTRIGYNSVGDGYYAGRIAFSNNNISKYVFLGAVPGNQDDQFVIGNQTGEKLRIAVNGNIGIGTTTPTEKLEVNGAVKATSFKVGGTTLNVPDYVFEEGYKLKTLDEVQALIAEHGHLPGVPSAKEINKNGLDMVGMQLKLLEKVEELTLYTIDQHKEIQKLKEENLKLKEKEALIETILKRVEKLENK